MQGAIGKNNRLTEINRSAVVRILQQQEVCSRADIARKTGLTQAAITKIVAALIEMGIVVEVGSIIGSDNRRSIGLKLNAGKHQVIGIKFARQMYAIGVFDISGRVYTQTITKYPINENPKTVVASIKQEIHDFLAKYKDVVSIGLALPGPYMRDEGRIAVVTQMTAWHDINFLENFTEDDFGKPVFIEHDANAGALAEWLFGGHRQPIHSLAYFLVGDGVGSGIIENGSLMVGSQGAASEIGHTSVDVHGARCECGNYGCLELYCSAQAILQKMKRQMPEYLPVLPQSTDACEALFREAHKGNETALAIVREVGEYIGYGCVTLIYSYNPDIIVIGDIVSQGGDLLLPIIKEVVEERVIPELHTKVAIQITKLKVDPTLYGAAAAATDKVLQLPTQFSVEGSKETDAL